MATLNELSYNILNIARGGLSSDDDRLNTRQIKFWVKYYRAFFIKKTIIGEDVIDPQLVQDLGCLHLEEVDKADCPTAFWGTNIKRVKIPKLVDLPNGIGLVFIGLLDKITPIILNDPDVVSFKVHQRFTGNMRRAYFIGEYLYVTDPFNEDICYINVRGIFDDPTAINVTHQDGTTDCYKDDDNYPMPESYTAQITAAIMQRELQMTLGSTNDETNDSREPNSKIDDTQAVE
jgi:hypothetical protein|tara:strand:- start:1012 stop:1710 length:699 start_codon:yes stop_codon:yes gene_type:complete